MKNPAAHRAVIIVAVAAGLWMACVSTGPEYTGGPAAGGAAGTGNTTSDAGVSPDASTSADASIDAGSSGPGEGAACTAQTPCAMGSCRVVLTPTDTVQRCTSCTDQTTGCGGGGFCVQQSTALGVVFVCSFGRPSDPCLTNSQCQSTVCTDRTPASGVVRFCQ